MANDFQITFRGDHIHIEHARGFEMTPANLERLFKSLLKECEAHDCRRVIAEADAPVRQLNTVDAYQSSSELSESDIRGIRMACCFRGYQPDELTSFFVTVAANRGTQIRFFTDMDAAREWLGIAGGDPGSQGDG